MKNYRFSVLFIIVSFSQIACVEPYLEVSSDLRKNAKLVSIGKEVFNKNCVTCHKLNGAGNPDWRKRGKDGFMLPPPLNGSGHTWHHSGEWLMRIIKNGSAVNEKGIKGKMPAWKDKLDLQQVSAVLVYLQSLWPEEIYQRWVKIDAR